MHLIDMLERVKSRETFLDFVEALMEDRADETRKERVHPSSPWGAGANGWEHHSSEDYLEAALAWARATSAETQQRLLPEEPSWQAFAEYL